MVTFKEDVLQKLKKAREDKGLTQGQLGELLSVSRVTISRWESGERCPDLDTIERISEILGMKPCFSFAINRQASLAELRLNHAISALSNDSKDKLIVFLESIG